MVDAVVMIKFRGLVSTFHSANGAAADCQRRLNSARQTLFLAREERKRQGNIRFAQPHRHAEHAEHLRQLDAKIAGAAAVVDRLADEFGKLQERAENAKAVAFGARDFLAERGLARTELEI